MSDTEEPKRADYRIILRSGAAINASCEEEGMHQLLRAFRDAEEVPRTVVVGQTTVFTAAIDAIHEVGKEEK